MELHDFIKMLVALGLGAILGFEREYRSKAAGFRTLTMISIGACLFTIVSQYLGHAGSPDRIASNIVQGIGFLGAGVIFKDQLSVSGLTTATAIWVASAVGMCVGAGEFQLATLTTFAAIVVLSAFEYIQKGVDMWHQYRVYRITYLMEHLDSLVLESEFRKHRIRFTKRKESREQDRICCWYELYGRVKAFQTLDRYLVDERRVIGFDN